MGGCLSTTDRNKEGGMDNKKGSGPVKHRAAASNRVDENEMNLAELKSRINKLQQYKKKIET